MSHLPLSNKGWLRQYWPQHRPYQLERFNRQVVIRLNDCRQPTARQIESVRQAAYRDMTGAIE